MGSRVTIKDVAKAADVSIKTVSNVINNTGRMRPDTRQRVEGAMRQLGYTVKFVGACHPFRWHQADRPEYLRLFAAVCSVSS